MAIAPATFRNSLGSLTPEMADLRDRFLALSQFELERFWDALGESERDYILSPVQAQNAWEFDPT